MILKIFDLPKLLHKSRQKEPTFIEKVDRWQTEMYLHKLELERKDNR